MPVIWLNGTVGSGKSAVGRALAGIVPNAAFVDGDDYAGPDDVPAPVRWQIAMNALLRLVVRPGKITTLIVAYPLGRTDHARLRAACGKVRRILIVVNLATPLTTTLRGRGPRMLDADERKRVRVMRSEGYHRRAFANAALPNARHPAMLTARQIVCLLLMPANAKRHYPLRW